MSSLFGGEKPIRRHLVRLGKRGVPGEVADLRRDIEAAFDRLDRILTPEGGFARSLINKTGAASVKGTLVRASDTTDDAFRVSGASCLETIGVVYEDGVPDGEECLVVRYGRAQVLLKDGTASVHGNWAATSDVAGRADVTAAAPNPVTHFQEIGHCTESKNAGTDVLAFCEIHLN